ncbi:MAG: hypothetical protein Q7I95_07395, partial [Thiobacillus sp.]|nr:hypothetical protein [Thiobacillus sp.]
RGNPEFPQISTDSGSPRHFVPRDDGIIQRVPKETLNKSTFVIPAKAGIQLNQASGPRLSPG